VTFVTQSLIIKTIYLTARIIPNSIDLIIGRQTLKKYNFFSLTPLEIGIPGIPDLTEREQILKSTDIKKIISLDKNESTFSSHSGKSTGFQRMPSNDGVINHSLEGCDGQCDNCTHDSNHGGVSNPTYTLSHIVEGPQNTLTAAKVETPSGIILPLDEIDNEKTDTFSPFLSTETTLPDKPKSGPEFLNEITFEGTEYLQKKLRQLCLKYSDIFSDHLPPKPAKLNPFTIEVNKAKWEVNKNRTPLRSQSVKRMSAIRKAIDEMKRSGVIEESNAVYYSHPVMVQKTADTYRFCIDYRNLNECTEASSWPLPNIQAMLERIGHYRPDTFGVMDLTSGYHQAPMANASKVLTAFICFCGVFQFTRLPFGPRRAPSYFQEQMAKVVLNGLIYMCCEMYLDDCIVYARGDDEFLERLEAVFRRFRCFGLYLKAKKCKFGMKSIEYVGRTISVTGISMSRAKIESILKFPKPTNLTSLRSLLGLANYFRNFVPYHADIVAPLQRMIDPKRQKRRLKGNGLL
jgi:hypothetical protein